MRAHRDPRRAVERTDPALQAADGCGNHISCRQHLVAAGVPGEERVQAAYGAACLGCRADAVTKRRREFGPVRKITPHPAPTLVFSIVFLFVFVLMLVLGMALVVRYTCTIILVLGLDLVLVLILAVAILRRA